MVSLVRQDLVRFIGGVLNVEGGGLGGGANVTGGGVGNNSFGGGPRHVSPLSRATDQGDYEVHLFLPCLFCMTRR